MSVMRLMRGGLVAAAVVAVGMGAVFTSSTPASAKKIMIKLGHPLPPKTGLHKWAQILQAGLAKRLGDRVEMKIFPVSQLGAIPRMIEGAQLGT
ncbi:MAG: hypothetical protein HQ514_09605, partial [Rhodospirillales bacterium]|nr:hypothetical protein [Rhodospirillales bacterium]